MDGVMTLTDNRRRVDGSRSSLIVLLFVCVLLAGAFSLAVAAQPILYVNMDAVGADDGTSWIDAFTDLQDALATAAAGGGYEIWVAEGTYTPTDDSDRAATFQLLDGAALYGGFAGGETSRGQRDWDDNETVLSGDLNGDDGPNWAYRGDNSHHVVTGGGTDCTAMLDGFTVTGGNAYAYGGGMYNASSSPTVTHCTFSGNGAHDGGGGMYNTSSSSPTVTDCTFTSNDAYGCGSRGGGMYNASSNPTVTDCSFFRNEASVAISWCDPWEVQDGYGGGMYNTNSSPTVTRCRFSGNTVGIGLLHNWYAGYGGGMFNGGGSPTVADCTFSGNGASHGGGMFNSGSSPTVTDCTFYGNRAEFGISDYVHYGSGGGMYNSGSSPTLSDCTFSNNYALSSGGGMYNTNSSPTVTSCSFSGNGAPHGGGMYNSGSSPTVTDCTFYGNRAEHAEPGWVQYAEGGGMYNENSSPTVTDCTFSGNLAADNGGGMANSGSNPMVAQCTFFGNSKDGIHNYTSNPTVKNTLLAGNSPDDCRSGATSTFTSGGYNLESATSCGCTQPTDQQDTDPLLGPLQDNGGPTLTHALLLGSPAIDAIPPPYNSAPATDQRGFPRPYPPGGFADIGAVEMQLAYANGDVNGDGAIDLLDVVLCAQIASGLVQGTAAQRAAADVDDDGDVDADDVTILSEYVLGIRPTLP